MIKISRISLAFLALGLAAATGGCGISKALGGGKQAPDEFAIATKAPLVVPPDYALAPPRPGESRPQELSPSERARQVLLGDATAAPPTVGEQLLLRKAGALVANPSIRNLLNAENGGRGEKDRSFANQLLFWNFIGREIDDSAAPLRVEDAEEWMTARQRVIDRAIGENAEVEIKKSKTLGLPGVF
jgi:DUF3035 family protein